MVRVSGKLSGRVNQSRKLEAKRAQIRDDTELLVSSCPNIKKLNLVVHHQVSATYYLLLVHVFLCGMGEDINFACCLQIVVVEESDTTTGDMDPSSPWSPLSRLESLCELDLVTMRWANVRPLLKSIGSRLTSLTLEMGEEQGSGSEIVFLGRCCPELLSLKLILGERILKGEMTLHFGSHFFRRLQRLHVEGSVHLHAFAFLWGHCRKLTHMRIGLVISNELTNTNMLIHDVFTLLFQVSDLQYNRAVSHPTFLLPFNAPLFPF